MKLSALRILALLLLGLTLGSRTASAGTTCIESGGLEVCVNAKGPCHLSQLMPREKIPLELEMMMITIQNKSSRRVRIDPENFLGVTEGGQAVKLDIPLLQSIELRTVLRKTDLAPQAEARGYLFFPTWMGPVRTLFHRGFPTFKINLY